MIIMGIDPGLRGGIIFLEQKKIHIISQHIIPVTSKKEIDINRIYSLIKTFDPIHIFVEHSQALPIKKLSSVATFNFGYGFGKIIAMLEISAKPFTLVKPKMWQKMIFIGAPTGIKPKEKSQIIAKRLFPNCNFIPDGCRKPHDGLIDAALIAYWGAKNI